MDDVPNDPTLGYIGLIVAVILLVFLLVDTLISDNGEEKD